MWFDIPASFDGDLEWPEDSPFDYGPNNGDVHILALTPKILGKEGRERDRLVERAKHGQQIRLLLSGGLAALSWSKWQENIETSFKILEEFKRALVDAECDHCFEVRELIWPPSIGMILVGVDESDGVASISVYTPDPQTERSKKTVLRLDREKTPDLFEFYRSQFLGLWRQSSPLNPAPATRYRSLRATATDQFHEILTKTIDYEIAFVVALDEEFREFADIMGLTDKHDKDPQTGQYVYKFEVGQRKCVAVLVGAMGHTAVSQLVERIASIYSVQTVVSVGISGAMDGDVSAGDVVVASQVNSYNENAKSRSKEDQFFLDLGGQAFKTTHRFWGDALHLEFAHPDLWDRWRGDCEDNLCDLLRDVVVEGDGSESELLKKILGRKKRLSGGEAIRNLPRFNIRPGIHANDAHVASGPIVGASKHFVKWLKETGDRKVLALDMESGGLVSAAVWRSRPLQTLVVRGISDLSDADKSGLEKHFGTAIRKIAMRNACRLVKLMLENDLLSRTG